MSGRNRIPRDAHFDRHGYHSERAVIRGHMPRPLHPHPALLEEELDIQHAEMQRLLAEHRRLVEDQMTLQRDLTVSKDEIHRMNCAIADIQADGELRMRDLVEKAMKLEADLQAIEHLKSESMQLQDEVQKLNRIRKDLTVQVQTLKKDVGIFQSENKQIPLLKSDIDGLRNELLHARNAMDFEKKANVELSEHRQTMETNLVSMAREAERLRATLGSVDSRPWGAVQGGPYGMMYGSTEGGGYHHAPPYGDPYAAAAATNQGAADMNSYYVNSSAGFPYPARR